MMYEGLFQYLEKSNLLKGRTFNFDFIGGTPVEWTLAMPDNVPEISKDAIGNTRCKLNFMIVSIRNFGNDNILNMENLEMFQSIKRWFATQNNARNYPDIGKDKIVTGVYAVSDPSLETTTTNVGRYQIMGRVEYILKSTSSHRMPTWL